MIKNSINIHQPLNSGNKKQYFSIEIIKNLSNRQPIQKIYDFFIALERKYVSFSLVNKSDSNLFANGHSHYRDLLFSRRVNHPFAVILLFFWEISVSYLLKSAAVLGPVFDKRAIVNKHPK